MGPAPTTASRGGSVVRSNTVSLVRAPASASPAIGGTTGRAPVAIMARLNLRVAPATVSVSRPVNRPSPRKTSTPSVAKAGGRVVGGECCPEPAHARHDRGEVDAGALGHADAEVAGVAHVGRGARRAQQRLGRHAADVETVAAEALALDQCHPATEAGRAGGRDQPGGAGAEDHEVIAARGRRVDPVGRAHVREQRAVMHIGRDPGGRHPAIRGASAARATRVAYTVTASVATKPSA